MSTFGNLVVRVVEGDVAQVEADALATAINPGGMWFGGIDGVIGRAVGSMFHDQAEAVRRSKGLAHGDTVVARATRLHRGRFGDVVFVVDALEGPLRVVVGAALRAADAAGYRTLSLPAIRTGVMLGVVEKDAASAVREIVVGIGEFAPGARSLRELMIVVFGAPQIAELIRATLPRAVLDDALDISKIEIGLAEERR